MTTTNKLAKLTAESMNKTLKSKNPGVNKILNEVVKEQLEEGVINSLSGPFRQTYNKTAYNKAMS
jgi:hypothetical protein